MTVLKVFMSGVLLFLFSSCASSFKETADPRVPGSIYGKWEYRACSYKNTSVKGFIIFRRDGTFVLNVKARDDTGGKTIRGTFPFSVEGNRISTGYDGGYGMEEFFLIEGDRLYLSSGPITKALVPEDPRFGANWGFELERVE